MRRYVSARHGDWIHNQLPFLLGGADFRDFVFEPIELLFAVCGVLRLVHMHKDSDDNSVGVGGLEACGEVLHRVGDKGDGGVLRGGVDIVVVDIDMDPVEETERGQDVGVVGDDVAEHGD